MRLPRAPSKRGLRHGRRAGLAAGAGRLRVLGECQVRPSVGRQADLSNKLKHTLGGGSGERCIAPQAQSGRRPLCAVNRHRFQIFDCEFESDVLARPQPLAPLHL